MSEKHKDARSNPALAAVYWELYQQGFSCEKIANGHGVARQSVWALLKSHGYQLRIKKQLPFVMFNGNKYTANGFGYYRRTVRDKNYALHRDIWEHHYGAIPPNYDIHHKNEDKQDNRIENLECISKSEHTRLHTPGITTRFKGNRVKRLDTGEVFESVKVAADHVGVTPGAITSAMKRSGSCKKTKWEYVVD